MSGVRQHEVVVAAATFDELFVRAPFDDASVVDDDDRVAVTHRGETMGDDEPSDAEPCQIRLDDLFGDRIEVARGLVEHEQRRSVDERTRQGDPLPFATRQARPEVTQHRRVPHRHRHHDLVDRSQPCRLADIVQRGVRRRQS